MTLNDARLVVLLLLLATVLLVFGNLDYSRFPPPLALPAAATSTPPPRPGSEATRAPIGPRPGEVVVQITEAELSDRVSQRLVGRSIGGGTVERAQVALRDGSIETSGTARLAGAPVPFTSSMTATPDAAGRVKLSVTDARIGAIPLPEAARSELEVEVQHEVDGLLTRQPIRVRSIEIAQGVLRAIGNPGG